VNIRSLRVHYLRVCSINVVFDSGFSLTSSIIHHHVSGSDARELQVLLRAGPHHIRTGLIQSSIASSQYISILEVLLLLLLGIISRTHHIFLIRIDYLLHRISVKAVCYTTASR
jgi:hypothetical protein